MNGHGPACICLGCQYLRAYIYADADPGFAGHAIGHECATCEWARTQRRLWRERSDRAQAELYRRLHADIGASLAANPQREPTLEEVFGFKVKEPPA